MINASPFRPSVSVSLWSYLSSFLPFSANTAISSQSAKTAICINIKSDSVSVHALYITSETQETKCPKRPAPHLDHQSYIWPISAKMTTWINGRLRLLVATDNVHLGGRGHSSCSFWRWHAVVASSPASPGSESDWGDCNKLVPVQTLQTAIKE